MDCPVAVSLLAVALTGCPGPKSQWDTDAGSQGTGTTSQGDTEASGTTGLPNEGCSGHPNGTAVEFEYSEAWIVDPIEPETPLWTAPREVCEQSMILALDFTADGAFYVIGTAFLFKETCGGYDCSWRYWLRRVSAEGEEMWVKTFDHEEIDLRALQALADGGVVVGGAAMASQDRAPWLARFDAAGSLLWEDIFVEHGQINAIARGPDDVVVAVGSVVAGASTDLWAAQASPDGAVAWTKTLGDDRYEAAVAVVVDSAVRSWIVGGRSPWVPDGLGPSSFEPLGWFDQSLVALMDDQGGLVWLDEPTPMDFDPPASRGALGVDLLPGGDAVVGATGEFGLQWIARYAADGSRVWETIVESADADEYWVYGDIEDLACDALGRTYVLASGRIVQLDDAGGALGTLNPHTYGGPLGGPLALTPAGALRITDLEDKGTYFEEGLGG